MHSQNTIQYKKKKITYIKRIKNTKIEVYQKHILMLMQSITLKKIIIIIIITNNTSIYYTKTLSPILHFYLFFISL